MTCHALLGAFDITEGEYVSAFFSSPLSLSLSFSFQNSIAEISRPLNLSFILNLLLPSHLFFHLLGKIKICESTIRRGKVLDSAAKKETSQSSATRFLVGRQICDLVRRRRPIVSLYIAAGGPARGYYDAGDNVKYGLPMAFKVTTLAWGAIFYETQLQAAGEHKPGTEIAAETSAAMAAASIVFRKTDKKYARQLLKKVKVLDETFTSRMQQLLNYRVPDSDLELPRCILEAHSMLH
ncbi:uncharacterized protein [Spinacia oleracea]|uniref:cellulase n=1 Tax=Spinacia oleracea TaxID=3562 RepID=A0ABM3QXJ4_SPIOL|nr:uncharacterized protein LOC110804989 [Spinacia oleracea]